MMILNLNIFIPFNLKIECRKKNNNNSKKVEVSAPKVEAPASKVEAPKEHNHKEHNHKEHKHKEHKHTPMLAETSNEAPDSSSPGIANQPQIDPQQLKLVLSLLKEIKSPTELKAMVEGQISNPSVKRIVCETYLNFIFNFIQALVTENPEVIIQFLKENNIEFKNLVIDLIVEFKDEINKNLKGIDLDKVIEQIKMFGIFSDEDIQEILSALKS